MIIPVILAGGSGTRLWPMSRQLFPKQLLRLTGTHTMLQQTLLRAAGVENAADPVLICNREHRCPVEQQVRELGPGQKQAMILEPVGRNTAPAVAVAALKALSADKNARILVLPADHLIKDNHEFRRSVAAADRYAELGYLITFGVTPDSPETGYGYIRRGKPLQADGNKGNGPGTFEIDQFVEKPDLQTAEKYLASGRYFWNSGMFLFRAADVWEQLRRFSPQIASSCLQAWQDSVYERGALCLDNKAFAGCPSDSIDYAVMEKTEKGAMVSFDSGWSDLGSWAAMWEAGGKDADGNVIDGEVIARGVNNSLVFSDRRLVAVLGMQDCVVIDTYDALLVADRFRSQDVKAVAEALKDENRREALRHETAYHEWGAETEIAACESHAIRKLSLEPSRQAEISAPEGMVVHMTVVSGSGRMVRNGSAGDLQRGDFVNITPESGVNVENTGDETLVIIEVKI
ncbi:MAG: mannose-1-phosphate guanylyltransferase/mannose-6-phosphate isomerase [Desulfobacterales bacterium]